MSANEQMIYCVACGATNRVGAGKSLTAAKCGRCSKPLATPAPVDVNSEQFAGLQAKDTGAYVLDVWAPWCGPCRMMAPHFEAAAARFSADVRFFKLNTDANQAAAGLLQIRGVPTLIARKGGRVVAHEAGAKTGASLDNWIQTSLNVTSKAN
jgi:thioredoxin 2